MTWRIIATKTGLDREVVARGLATRKEAWDWKIMHAEKFTPRILYLEREEEKKPTLKEIFTGVTLDTWVERARVKGLNEFKNLYASPEFETLETPFVWRAFREWVKRSLREDVDVKVVLEALDDIDKKLTYSEAQDFLMKTDDPKFAWIRMQFKDVKEMAENPLVSEMRKTIEGARRAGITDRQLITVLRSMDIELERPTSKGLAEAQKEIARLTEEVTRLQREKIIPEWKPYWSEQEKAVELYYREYPSEETYFRLREARPLLERAYAGDPYITMWLGTHHFTTKDLEDEVVRLTRAVAGARVPSYTLDVLRMSEQVAEKQRRMPTLMEMELILEGAQKLEKWALERMEAKYGITNVYEFEGKVVKLREEVGDPPPHSYLKIYEFPTLQELKVEKGITYDLPHIPELELHITNRIRTAEMIDSDGTILEATARLDRINGWRRRYRFPSVRFSTVDVERAELFANLIRVPVPTHPINREYVVSATTSRAIAVILYITPYLTRPFLKERANTLLHKYKDRPSERW